MVGVGLNVNTTTAELPDTGTSPALLLMVGLALVGGALAILRLRRTGAQS